jgi:hypothetical protein
MPLKCTKCSRPRRGHVGPADEGCTLADAGPGYGLGVHEELSADESEQSEQEKLDIAGGGNGGNPGPTSPLKKKSPRKRSEAFAMKELLIQMGNLACTVQKMSEETKSVSDAQKKQHADMKLLRSAIAASSKKPSVVTPPVVTPQLLPRPLLAPPYHPASFNPPPVDNNAAPEAGAGVATLQGTQNPGLEQSIPLPNGARISKKTFLSARAGDYINLSEFAPNSEPSSVMESVIDETTGNLVFKSKNIKRAIDCFLSWSRAWAGYESLLINMLPTLYQALADYRLFIQTCDAIYQWSAVTSYDQRHRHRTSLTNSVDFNTCSTDIYVCTLNANTVRPNPKTCYACGSIDHSLKDCPFQRQSNRPSQPS